MADIFISYASEDREWVRKLATTLEESGWSVWWDRNIIAGQAFDQVIEHELEVAKSVVVVWSKNSISSEWVKNEASVASDSGLLVPIQIDHIQVPLEFRRKQTADLVGWDGSSSHEGLQIMKDGLAEITKKAEEKKSKQDANPSLIKKIMRNHHLYLYLAIFVLITIIIYILNIAPTPNKSSDKVTQPSSSEEALLNRIKVKDNSEKKLSFETNSKTLDLSGQTIFPGVVAYLSRFEKTGGLVTLELTLKNIVTKNVEICANISTYGTKIIDENTGSSWPVTHSGGEIHCKYKTDLSPSESHLVWIKYSIKNPESKKFTLDWEMLKRPLEGLVISPKPGEQ